MMLNVLCVLLQSDPLLQYMKVESTKIPLAGSRAVSKVKDHTHKSLKNQGLTHYSFSLCLQLKNACFRISESI